MNTGRHSKQTTYVCRDTGGGGGGGGERDADDDDEVMLNVLRCQLTY